MTLAELLQRELEIAGSMSALVAKAGVAHTSIQPIIDGTGGEPKLLTLVKFSRAFNLPLWRVMEMAGYDMGFGSAKIAQRIASLIESVPEFQEGLQELLNAAPGDIQGMLAYLEAQRIVRERRAHYDVDRSQ